MIPKLRSKHPIDIPVDWKNRPGVVALAFTLTGLVLLAGLLGNLALNGPKVIGLVIVGLGSFVVVLGFVAAIARARGE